MARNKRTAADEARLMITVGAWALTLLYGYLELSWKPFHELTRSLPAKVLFQVGLLLYFVAWWKGASWDVDEQQAAFDAGQVQPALAKQTYAAGAGMVAVFAAVCWLGSKPPTWFLAGLLAFWIANAAAWHLFLRAEIQERIRVSFAVYTSQHLYARAKVLSLVREHMLGTWQAVRFAAGAGELLAMNAAVWKGWVPVVASRVGLPTDILFSLAILGFVVLAEAPIWFSRVRVRSAREALEELEEDYGLVPLRRAELDRVDASHRGGTVTP